MKIGLIWEGETIEVEIFVRDDKVKVKSMTMQVAFGVFIKLS